METAEKRKYKNHLMGICFAGFLPPGRADALFSFPGETGHLGRLPLQTHFPRQHPISFFILYLWKKTLFFSFFCGKIYGEKVYVF